MDAASFSFSSLQSYLSTEYMSFLWPILAIIFTLAIANYIIVNEVDKGTSETLFSLPIKRTKLFLSRYFCRSIANCCIYGIKYSDGYTTGHDTWN